MNITELVENVWIHITTAYLSDVFSHQTTIRSADTRTLARQPDYCMHE